MDILDHIKNQIDTIKSSPESVDIDRVSESLGLAYEVAQDGLKRSHAATLFGEIKPEFDQLKIDHEVLTGQFKEIKKKLSKAETELEIFNPLLKELKTRTVAWLNLINIYSDKFRESLKSQIEKADVKIFLDLRVRVEEDFNREWKQPKEKLQSTREIIESKNFRTGG